MKVGSFNINSYLEKLYEGQEESAPKVDTKGGPKDSKEGLIIPEENQKSFSWLKREYDKNKVEVKVEIKMGGAKFEPGYDLQTDLKSVKEFKPGMFGDNKSPESKSSDAKPPKTESSETKSPQVKAQSAEKSEFPKKFSKDPSNKDGDKKESKGQGKLNIKGTVKTKKDEKSEGEDEK